MSTSETMMIDGARRFRTAKFTGPQVETGTRDGEVTRADDISWPERPK